jgi:hypothetical protein
MHEEQERADFEAWADEGENNLGLMWKPRKAAWEGWQARASLAKPQPVGGALTDQIIDEVTETVATYDIAGWKLWGRDQIRRFALAIESQLATLSAPVAQPGEAVSEPAGNPR